MTCPHCRKAIDPAVIPDEIIASERGRRNSAKRATHTGGRNGGRPKRVADPILATEETPLPAAAKPSSAEQI